MKKIFFGIATVTFAVSLFSCKKEKKEEDIAPMFKNTVWTGEIKYDNVPVSEPFSLSFDGSGKFTMEERTRTSNGLCFTDKATNTVTIQLTKGTFKETISNRQFSNITYNGVYLWKINSGGLINEPLQVLSNSLWKGIQMSSSNNQQPWQMRFLTDKIFVLNNLPDNYTYTRSGINIRLEFVNNGYYFALQPHNKIKGIFWDFFLFPALHYTRVMI